MTAQRYRVPARRPTCYGCLTRTTRGNRLCRACFAQVPTVLATAGLRREPADLDATILLYAERLAAGLCIWTGKARR